MSPETQKSKKILIVDDEAALLNLMGATLAGCGYQVLYACSHRTAMNMFERHPGKVGLVVTDVSLPEKSGFELAEDLVALDSNIKVLFISGRAGAEVFKFHRMSVPEHHFLEKPFAMAALITCVKSIMGPAVSVNTVSAE